MKLANKTIGIWGFGLVGQSAARLCSQHGAQVIVFDANETALRECPHPIAYNHEALFNQCDFIIPSPGIAITPYKKMFAGKWLFELDLFQSLFKKKIGAITGSIGKTSVTHLLTQTLRAAGLKVMAAGNIGTPLLDCVEKQHELDLIILEVSSFQLEHTESFAPDLAIWTNFYPNHLDRHITIENYFDAKYHLIQFQKSSQSALIPIELKNAIEKKQPKSCLHSFDPLEKPQHALPGFKANLLIIEKALSLLNIPFPQKIPLTQLEHRLEKVCAIQDTLFINDSKSTTIASTKAAVELFKGKQIILLLGGLSKGVDRSQLIASLPNTVEVLCFGAESEELFNMCRTYTVRATAHTHLFKAIDHALRTLKSNTVVLLSPAGSSFDEFKNFEERGNLFKKIVLSYKETMR